MNREKEIFEQALDLPSGKEREAFLMGACAGNEALLERVRGLLRAHDEPGAFLPEAPQQAATVRMATDLHPPITEKPGDKIGRYKLLQQIGEGGCGVVYMAEQEEPVRRRVALKVIKLGMDTKTVIARFEAERQALALMDHPNIAKVLDAGATETGRPYFVMELVRGIRLTEYCDQRKLGVRERLGLFMPVCQAIQHAHQKGIIHRDIKPSNILITLHDGVPVPKVIDFGIAKATDQKLTDKTLFTQYDSFIGTPAYMSPEQAEMSGLDIDTRSDIYSLGVLLYELLTGVTPFNPKTLLQSGIDEMRRMIREDEPQCPSTRLSTLEAKDAGELAKHHQEKLPALINLVRGDLDWIVMKCLEKDRQRRYETANGLAMDIERHLGNEPIVARPPSATYRLQKMVRRNKLAFAAAAAVFAALLAGLSVSTWMYLKQRAAYRQAQAAEAAASTEAMRSRQVAQFLEDMLAGVGPSVAKGQDTKMLREILDRTAQRLDTDLKNQPLVEANLRIVIGSVYLELGEAVQAEKVLRPNLELLRDKPRFAAQAAQQLGSALRKQHRLDEAEQLFRQSLEGYRKQDGNEGRSVAQALESIGAVMQSQGRLREAETNFIEALAIDRRRPDHVEVDSADRLLDLAIVVILQGRKEEGERLYRQALPLVMQKHGKDSLQYAEGLGGMSVWLRDYRRAAEAEPLARESMEICRKLLGDGHKRVSESVQRLGATLENMGRAAEAEKLYRDTLARQRSAVGDRHEATALTRYFLAWFLQERERFAEAELAYVEALPALRELLGLQNPTVARALNLLGVTYYRQEKYANAEPVLQEAVVAYRNLPGTLRFSQRKYEAEALMNSGNVFRALTKWEEAESAYRESFEIRRKLFGDAHKEVNEALTKLGATIEAQGRFSDAENLYRETLGKQRQAVGDTHEVVAETVDLLGNLLWKRGRYSEAEAAHVEALATRRKLLGNEDAAVARSLNGLGITYLRQEKYTNAEPLLREALAIGAKVLGNESETVATVLVNLGNVLKARKQWQEAENAYRQALEIRRKLKGEEGKEVALLLNNFGALLTESGRFSEAETTLGQAFELSRKLDDQSQVASCLYNLGHLAYNEKNYAKAERFYQEAVNLDLKRLGSTHPHLIGSFDWLGLIQEAQGKLADSEASCRKAVAIADEQTDLFARMKGRNPQTRLFEILSRQKRGADAEPVARGIVKLARDIPASSPNGFEDTLHDLAQKLYRLDRFAQAESLYRERLASLQQRHSITNDKVLTTTASLGRCLSDRALSERNTPGALDAAREGERLLRHCLTVREGNTNTSRADLGDTKSRLAGARFSIAMCDMALTDEARLVMFPEIESVLLEGQQLMAQSSKPDADHQRDGFRRLIRLYETWDTASPNSGKATQAADWKSKLEAFDQAQISRQAPEGQNPEPVQ